MLGEVNKNSAKKFLMQKSGHIVNQKIKISR